MRFRTVTLAALPFVLVPAVAMGAKVVRANVVVNTAHAVIGGRVPGGKLTVTATFANVGKVAAKASVAQLRMSRDAKLSTEDLLAGTAKVPALAPTKKRAVVVTGAIPLKAVPGSYTLFVCADATRKVAESNEHDNCLKVGSFTVLAANGAPAAPTLGAITPASPNASLTPSIAGTGTPGSTVTLYGAASCGGAAQATAIVGTDGKFTVTGTPTFGATTSFTATVTANGWTSACSQPVTYQHRGITIEMRDYSFFPATASITVGTMVRWVNKGADMHSVDRNSSPEFHSPDLAPGQSYVQTFTSADEFGYVCKYHGGIAGPMNGTLTVTGS